MTDMGSQPRGTDFLLWTTNPCSLTSGLDQLSKSANHPSRMVRDALEVAITAHEGQTRRHTGEPFILHPAPVALIISEYECDPPILAATLLHEAVEDTILTAEDLTDRSPASVARMVLSLTNPSDPGDGDRPCPHRSGRAAGTVDHCTPTFN